MRFKMINQFQYQQTVLFDLRVFDSQSSHPKPNALHIIFYIFRIDLGVEYAFEQKAKTINIETSKIENQWFKQTLPF